MLGDRSLADALQEGLPSTVETGEGLITVTEQEQNVVGGLFAIAAGLNRIAAAHPLLAEGSVSPKMGDALDGLASLNYRE